MAEEIVFDKKMGDLRATRNHEQRTMIIKNEPKKVKNNIKKIQRMNEKLR